MLFLGENEYKRIVLQRSRFKYISLKSWDCRIFLQKFREMRIRMQDRRSFLLQACAIVLSSHLSVEFQQPLLPRSQTTNWVSTVRSRPRTLWIGLIELFHVCHFSSTSCVWGRQSEWKALLLGCRVWETRTEFWNRSNQVIHAIPPIQPTSWPTVLPSGYCPSLSHRRNAPWLCQLLVSSRALLSHEHTAAIHQCRRYFSLSALTSFNPSSCASFSSCFLFLPCLFPPPLFCQASNALSIMYGLCIS